MAARHQRRHTCNATRKGGGLLTALADRKGGGEAGQPHDIRPLAHACGARATGGARAEIPASMALTRGVATAPSPVSRRSDAGLPYRRARLPPPPSLSIVRRGGATRRVRAPGASGNGSAGPRSVGSVVPRALHSVQTGKFASPFVRCCGDGALWKHDALLDWFFFSTGAREE